MPVTNVDRGSSVPPLPQVGKYPKGFDPRKAPADQRGGSLLDIGALLSSPIIPKAFTDALVGADERKQNLASGAFNAVFALAQPESGISGFARNLAKSSIQAPRLGRSLAETAENLGGVPQTNLARMVAEGRDFSRVPRTERLASEAANPSAVGREASYELGQRLDKLGIPDGPKNLIVKNALEDRIQAGTDIAFEKQRRGVVPVEVTDRKAQVLAEQMDIEQLSKTRPGTAFNAEENAAIRKSIAQKATDLDILNTSIQEVGLKNATADQKLAALKAALELNSLQRVGAGARAEAGRALRSFREVEEAIRSKTDAAYERAFQALGGRSDVEAKLARLQDIWNDSSRPIEARERDIYAFVKNIEKATTGKKLEEFWLNSILSNPITHEINTIGNALLLTAERLPTRLAASTVEELLTLHGALRPKAVTYTDTLIGAVRTFTAKKKAAQKALYYAKTGASDVDVNKFRESGTIGQRQALEGSAGTILNLPTRLLGVEDAFFYTMAYEGELAAQAARGAIQEGLNPFSAKYAQRVAELKNSEAVKEAATKSADLITLKSAPDAATEAILNLRRKVPAARFFVPFVQTPMNLLKRGFDYSPLGFTKLFKEGLTQEDKALVTGRAIVGSGILAYFAARVAEGEVTGPAPANAKQRELFYDQGYRPFSIKIGDAWVEGGRFEPLVTPIRWALAAKAAYEDSGEEISAETTMTMAAAIGRALIDTTYLSGMSNFLNAL